MTELTLGKVTISSGAKQALDQASVTAESLLKRHGSGDWGDLSPEGQEWNTQAIASAERVLSSYIVAEVQTIWIVTAADRSVTSVMLPGESGRLLGKQISGKDGEIAVRIIEAVCNDRLVEEIIEIAKSILDLAINHDGIDDYTRAQIVGKICWRYGLEPPDEIQDVLV